MLNSSHEQIAPFTLDESFSQHDEIDINMGKTFLLLADFNVIYIINAIVCVLEFDINLSDNNENEVVQNVCRINQIRNVFLMFKENQFMFSTRFEGYINFTPCNAQQYIQSARNIISQKRWILLSITYNT